MRQPSDWICPWLRAAGELGLKEIYLDNNRVGSRKNWRVTGSRLLLLERLRQAFAPVLLRRYGISAHLACSLPANSLSGGGNDPGASPCSSTHGPLASTGYFPWPQPQLHQQVLSPRGAGTVGTGRGWRLQVRDPHGAAAGPRTLWQMSLYLPWSSWDMMWDTQSPKGVHRGSQQPPPQHSVLLGWAEEHPARCPPGLSC